MNKRKDLVDAAALTEQMMQYANRYRHSHADIKAAIDKSLYLFTKEYRYQDALDRDRDSFWNASNQVLSSGSRTSISRIVI